VCVGFGRSMPFVYILETSSGKYYIGSTPDLNKRMLQHLSKNHTHSTKRMGELRLIFSQKYSNLSDARYVEQRLKRLKRKDYIDQIIKEGVIKIKPR
jgi:predicted GIY-YIG superfamily endonuclease